MGFHSELMGPAHGQTDGAIL